MGCGIAVATAAKVSGICGRHWLSQHSLSFKEEERYAPANQVGRPDVNGFVSSLVGLGASEGVFVTTSTLSQAAGTM